MTFKGRSPSDRPLILGHRGSPREAPENTLPSFLKAMEQGADGIELDVHLTRDGAIAVAHNYTLQKTTDGRGLLARQTLAELKQLNAGSCFGGDYSGARIPIPTLQEVIEALDEKALIMIEIKTYLAGSTNEKIASAVAGVVAEYDLNERTLVSSFNPFILNRIRRVGEHIPVGYLHYLPLPGFPGRSTFALCSRAAVLHPFHGAVSQPYMERARGLGCRVIPWTVNEIADLDRMIGLGVDGVITDRPGIIKEAMITAGKGR